MNPLVNIASPSGKPVAWEVRRAPAWLKLEPDRGETPTQALLRFQWGASGPVGAEGELVIGSGDYEVAIPVRAFVSQFWSSARWLEYNPADGHYYTESVGVYRIDPRSGLLDGRSLNLSSLADESLLAMNPLNGRIVSPLRAPSIATPRFAVLEPGSDYFVPAGGPQPISRSVGLAWIGAGSVASIDRSNDIFVSDLDGETVVDTYDFELVNSVRAFAGDVAGARWWISHTVSERQTPHVALSAFALEGSEIRLVASHIEDLAEWNPERPPLVFDPVADRVYWEGKVLDGGLTPVEGLSATILEVIPGAGIGFDAWGALDLDAGVRLLAWNEEAQRLAVGEEGPGLLIQTPAEPRLRLLPLDVVREAAEEFRGDREPAFLVRAVAPDHPEWTAIVFSVAETGVYRVQRSTNGTSWPSLTSAEVLTRGWHTRWVRSPATPAGAPVLYRVAKVMQN
jgi:hypothetical protein